MLTHPEDQVRVLAVPAVALVVGEEAPGESVVLVLHQNAHAASIAGSGLHVLLPDHGQEQRARGVHDSDVRE